MKIKTIGRIVGIVELGMSAMAFKVAQGFISRTDYSQINEFLTRDAPFLYKVGAATLAYGIPIFSGVCGALFLAEGGVDVIKGTHHYFGLRLWQKLSRNQETKEKIENDLENMLEVIERPVFNIGARRNFD